MKHMARIACITVVLFVGSVALAQAEKKAPAADGEAKTAKRVSYFDWFVLGGDWVGFILIALSFVSVSLIIQHFIAIRRTTLMPPHVEAQVKALLEARQFRELLTYTEGEQGIFAGILNRALKEAHNGAAAMEHEMENALQERVAKIALKPEILSILGNTGPLIGLYGTVLGIILAFSDICRLGGIPEPGELAGSIGVALVATFWGLTVAIPCLVVYAFMKNRIEGYANEAIALGRECLTALRPAAKR